MKATADQHEDEKDLHWSHSSEICILFEAQVQTSLAWLANTPLHLMVWLGVLHSLKPGGYKKKRGNNYVPVPTQQKPVCSLSSRCRSKHGNNTSPQVLSTKTSGFKAATVTLVCFSLSAATWVSSLLPAAIWCEVEKQLEVSAFVTLQTGTHH